MNSCPLNRFAFGEAEIVPNRLFSVSPGLVRVATERDVAFIGYP